MDVFNKSNDDDYGEIGGVHSPRDTLIQIVLSGALGIGAFIAFCILRPRWKTLYAARKQQRTEAAPLPEMPDSFFGWIPVLWRITEQQTLASVGLDAYVFLAFFRMAIKFLTVTLFFALVVIKPVHDAFPDKDIRRRHNYTNNDTSLYGGIFKAQGTLWEPHPDFAKEKSRYSSVPTDYLWMYLIFVYLFTALALWLVFSETERIIAIRQAYLGNLSTITDRTIRLSGIPPSMRSDEKIKEFFEDLTIGNVDSIMLCRNWKELDDLMDRRMEVLRRLEEAWTIYLSHGRGEENRQTLQPDATATESNLEDENDADDEVSESWETEHLLGANGYDRDSLLYVRNRPVATIRYGFMKLRSRPVDAIDYFEEQLQSIDDKIIECRKKDFEPTSLAFVTLDSVGASQMAMQAVLDPSPMQLIASTSPTPADVVWRNTYLPRSSRMFRAWSITLVITVLTIFWSVLLVPIATALNIGAIKKVWPQLAAALEAHEIAKSLVTTQLPTLVFTLLSVAVPYLYDWLATQQGMTSQGDVELSVISKNYFFTFFNVFLIFTVLGTASTFYDFVSRFGDTVKDATTIAYNLARSLSGLLTFYVNLIILQGLGLFPFRLLEFGSVALYPIYRFGAKTPRDFAELTEPPVFNYGFYLPQNMLIFSICIIYSILRDSWKVLLSGWVYFVVGLFVYKYQLLYAMDHRQRSTGRAWFMICNRTIVGLLFFQLATAGQLALNGAIKRSAVVTPLLVATVWFYYVYARSYEPLMKYISLRSIHRGATVASQDDDGLPEEDRLDQRQVRWEAETRPGNTVDDSSETGMRFINPNLIAPLDDVWVADKPGRDQARQHFNTGRSTRMESNLNAMF